MIPVYRDRGTPLQKLHPLAQLVLCFSLILLSLTNDSPFLQVSVIICCALLAAAAGVFREWLSWWKICLFIGLLALIINPLVSRAGTTVLWIGPRLPVFGRLKITLEALVYGAGMALRLSAMIWAFALLSLIMDPDRALGLLKGRGSSSALVSALTMKMVPTAMQDASEILDAQRARGVARDSGSRTAVLRSRIPVLKRLVVTSLDRGINLAEAMEARGYGSGRRTRFHEYTIGPSESFVLTFSLLIAGLGITAAVVAGGAFNYYPTLTWEFSAWSVVAAVLPIVAGLVTLILTESRKRWNWLRLRT